MLVLCKQISVASLNEYYLIFDIADCETFQVTPDRVLSSYIVNTHIALVLRKIRHCNVLQFDTASTSVFVTMSLHYWTTVLPHWEGNKENIIPLY